MPNQPKNRKIAAALAFAGVVLPGLHKFYLGQPRWGIVYLLLAWTPIPKFASVAEGLWYLFQDRDEFEHTFNSMNAVNIANPTASSSAPVAPAQVGFVAEALRQIEQLRQDGLMSEYEFEQKRRQLLDRIG